MGKLHEVLAVEPEIKSRSNAILNETGSVFTNKQDHFVEIIKTYQPTKEDGPTYPDEKKVMVTTVPDKLYYTHSKVAESFNIMAQKECANTQAKADVVVNGVTLAKDLPATVLLSLEKAFKQLKLVYMRIPTLDPSEDWEPSTQSAHCYKAAPSVKEKTKKTSKSIVLYEATEHHPAQVQMMTEDERVGNWTTRKKSGMMSPLEKTQLISRCDLLLQAIKKARCAANNQEAPEMNIGDALLDFVLPRV